MIRDWRRNRSPSIAITNRNQSRITNQESQMWLLPAEPDRLAATAVDIRQLHRLDADLQHFVPAFDDSAFFSMKDVASRVAQNGYLGRLARRVENADELQRDRWQGGRTGRHGRGHGNRPR